MIRLAALFSGVFACVSTASAQISAGPSGSGLITFDNAPAGSEWTTRPYGGDNGGAGIVNAAQLDVQVQVVSAADVTNALSWSSAVPPSQNNYARWNSAARYLQSKIGNVEFTVLMAKLTNNTGAALSCIGIRYEMGGGSFFGPESVPAFRGYYSLTGNAGSWVLIPGLCAETTGTVSTVVSFSSIGVWPHGSTLFLLWADDNGPNADPYYTIDDLEFTVAPRLAIETLDGGVKLSWPDEWEGFGVVASDTLFPASWQVFYPESSASRSNGYFHLFLPQAAGTRYFRSRGGF